jgi:hypothetical protein
MSGSFKVLGKQAVARPAETRLTVMKENKSDPAARPQFFSPFLA